MLSEQQAIRARLEEAYIPDPNSGCWLWTRCTRNGYGALTVRNKSSAAHRVSYEAHVGPIPEGLHIDHLCRTPACINPAHLEPVTNAENTRRGRGAELTRLRHLAKQYCKWGHPLFGENITLCKSSGQRICLTCRAERKRRQNAKIPKKGPNLDGLKLGGKASGEAKRARISHCPKGHSYSGDNLGITPQGWRFCRRCKCDKQMRRYAAKKASNNG